MRLRRWPFAAAGWVILSTSCGVGTAGLSEAPRDGSAGGTADATTQVDAPPPIEESGTEGSDAAGRGEAATDQEDAAPGGDAGGGGEASSPDGAGAPDAEMDGDSSQSTDATSDANPTDAGPVDSGARDAADAGCPFGTLACSGAQPQICTGALVWQNVGAPCSGTVPVCLAGACVTCAPGAHACSGQQPETCQSDGTWSVGSACAGQACVSGTCTGTCSPGATQCTSDTQVATCDATGQWAAPTSCAEACVGTVGVVGSGCGGSCVPGTTQCANATQEQTCSTSGQWETATTCATGVTHATASCAGGACTFACDTGYSACGGGCADFSSDDANCGGCGAAFVCTGVATCQSGACVPTFGYAPSNFTPTLYASDVPAGGTTVDCDVTYTSPGTAGDSTWCGGTGPYVIPDVAQPGGPAVDILVFSSLSVASGFTLTLTGSNPVILAVYGDAAIAGTVDASASGGTPGPGGNDSTYCGTAPQDSQNFQWGGGGGGGGAVAGGNGNRGNLATGRLDTGGGASPGASTVVPLAGGCSGEIGGQRCSGGVNTGNCQVCETVGTNCEPPGAGGGAVQISAAGTVDVTGAILANGGAGTSGGTSQIGGGGGGSAGDILLEGTAVTRAGLLEANGGPGGTGGNDNGNSTGGAGGAAGTNNGTSQTAPGDGAGGSGNFQGGGGGGGSYGTVLVMVP